MTKHYLKTWTQYFDEVERDNKPFELRFNDRDYSVGDTLVLQDYDSTIGKYTGRELERRVTYILDKAEMFGLKQGFVIMGLSKSLSGESELGASAAPSEHGVYAVDGESHANADTTTADKQTSGALMEKITPVEISKPYCRYEAKGSILCKHQCEFCSHWL